MGQNSSLSGAMLVLRLFIKLVDFVMLFLRKGGGPFGDDDDDDDHDMFLIVSLEYTLLPYFCSTKLSRFLLVFQYCF